MEKYIGQSYIVWDYEPVKLQVPRDGELVIVRDPNTMVNGRAVVSLLAGNGVQTIEELRGNVVLNISLVQNDLNALSISFNNHVANKQAHAATVTPIANRIPLYSVNGNLKTGEPVASDDAARKADVDKAIEIAEGAVYGIVFDTTAQLNAWLGGTYIRPDGQTPADLKLGESIYIRALNEPDYWWDGTYYLEQEVKIDLNGYRLSADQDDLDRALQAQITENAEAIQVLDETKAPIHSPDFTGIPLAPDPDFTIMKQILTVSAFWYLYDLIKKIAGSFVITDDIHTPPIRFITDDGKLLVWDQ
jgi:hypothetical protein